MRTSVLFMAVAVLSIGIANQAMAATFEFIIGEEKDAATFIAKTNDREVIKEIRAELAKPLAERYKHIHGPIDRGDEGYNRPWNWHFLHGKWILSEVSIGLCNATPSYVDDHLDEWLDKVGMYCPWNSHVSREIQIIIQ